MPSCAKNVSRETESFKEIYPFEEDVEAVERVEKCGRGRSEAGTGGGEAGDGLVILTA
jgi:hypothetical protein